MAPTAGGSDELRRVVAAIRIRLDIGLCLQ